VFCLFQHQRGQEEVPQEPEQRPFEQD